MKLENLMVEHPTLYLNDSLILALSFLAGIKSPYRVVIVDKLKKVRGIITGRRILEVLFGIRGKSILLKKGIKELMREPVYLFMDEAKNLFNINTPFEAVLKYMSENYVGMVIAVDEQKIMKGIVDEKVIFEKFKEKEIKVKVKNVMKKNLSIINYNDSLFDVALKMIKDRVRRLLVIKNKTLKGIVTITDILKYLLITEKHIEFLRYKKETLVKEILKEEKVNYIIPKKLITIKENEDLSLAISLMLNHNISSLPVINNKGKLKGIICRIDVISGLAKSKLFEAI